jgi:site-specific DNA-methyltransferase (adenine-specific)
MACLPDVCIPLVVTSPPYDATFIYGGHRWDFEIFKQVAQQLWRILMPGGVICWVVEDQSVGGSLTGTKHRQLVHFSDLGFRLHEELIIERSGITHHKNRHPEQVTTCFILSKGKPRANNRIADRPNVTAGERQRLNRRNRDGSRRFWAAEVGVVPVLGLRTNLWKVKTGLYHTTKDDVFEFPALMQEALAADLIRTFSRFNDLVLDPFSGAGTTAKMAMFHHRKYLGFEIWDKAYQLSQKRLELAKREYLRELDSIVRSESERRKSHTCNP